jgi:ferredoxin
VCSSDLNRATLHWTPTAADRADSSVLLRVVDSRGGVALRRYGIAVDGANHVPVLGTVQNQVLAEGQTLQLPLQAADADGDTVTLLIRNLPAGATFDAATGVLSWTPGYDQAGTYTGITVVASDGRHQVQRQFDITVAQGWPKPQFPALPDQVLREGDRFALQLPGSLPGLMNPGLQADGSQVTLSWTADWLPAGATLDAETGWFSWTPGYAQAGMLRVPVRLQALFTAADGSTTRSSVLRDLVLDVRNANGAPQFDPATRWDVLEGQPLRISLFAYDPDNPGYEPKVRLSANGQTTDGAGTPTVSYTVTGLPEGASFDAETLELVWTPGYAQAGTYQVTVTATDDGDGTGTTYPEFAMQRCTQCKRCTEECPFGAINEDEKANPLPNPTRCRRCGVCMGACPERIISFKNYSVDMIGSMIKGINVPEEDEEKPRVICLVCENDEIGRAHV